MKDLFTPEFWQDLLSQTQRWAIDHIPRIIVTVLLMLFTLWLFKLTIKRLRKALVDKNAESEDEDKSETEKRIHTLLDIARQAGRIVIYVVFIVTLLSNFGLEIGPILAGAGILGLAVGFGAQELVRDFISGFFLLLENRVRVGDVAVINGTGGLVESIDLRTITLRDLAGVTHVFQNGKINTLSNMTMDWSAYVFDIGIAYKENPEEVMDVIRQLDEEFRQDEKFAPLILEPLELFGVDKLGDSAVIIKARYKTRPIEQWNVGREFNKRLKKAFDAKGIEIPFPHQTIYWGEEINPLKMQLEDRLPKGK